MRRLSGTGQQSEAGVEEPVLILLELKIMRRLKSIEHGHPIGRRRSTAGKPGVEWGGDRMVPSTKLGFDLDYTNSRQDHPRSWKSGAS